MNSDGEPTPIRNLAPLRDAPPDLTAEKMIGVMPVAGDAGADATHVDRVRLQPSHM